MIFNGFGKIYRKKTYLYNGRKTWFPVEVPNKTNPMRYHGSFIKREIYWDSTPQDNKT
jgi:hypothetical protein